ncbi:MAG: hypothetical protein AB7O38_12630, partial [Pirellulaceae bacterium]
QAVVWVKARYDQLVARQSTLKKDLEQEEQSVRLAAEQLATAQRAAGASRDEQTQAVRHVAEAEQQWAELNQRALAARELSLAAFTRATEEGVKRAFIAPLDPLTPEQLGWSIQIVTGIAAQHRAAAAAELAKKSPADAAATEEKRRAFERELEQTVYQKLNGQVRTFVELFGHASGQPQRDFYATADQALFFANGGVLQSWLAPNGDNLTARLSRQTDSSQVAEELYLSVFSRRPSRDEIQAVTQYLAGRNQDRATALQEMAWGLITSNEFRFQ